MLQVHIIQAYTIKVYPLRSCATDRMASLVFYEFQDRPLLDILNLCTNGVEVKTFISHKKYLYEINKFQTYITTNCNSVNSSSQNVQKIPFCDMPLCNVREWQNLYLSHTPISDMTVNMADCSYILAIGCLSLHKQHIAK